MKKILFIAGFPPPASGQLIMQKKLYDLVAEGNKKLISLNFSNDSKDFSKMSFKKIRKLLMVVLQITKEGVFSQSKTDKVYYSLSGPKKGALVKDIVIGLPLNLFFKKKLVLQVHAGGYTSTFVENKILFSFLKWLYKNTEHLLCLTEFQKSELEFLRPRNTSIVYNFCEDVVQGSEPPLRGSTNSKSVLRLLSVGHLNANKGVEESMLLASQLKINNIDFRWKFIGSFQNPSFEMKIREMVRAHKLESSITFESEIPNNLILSEYGKADFLIFLSNGPEGQPVVLIEALMVAKAIVITKSISGIDEYIRHGHNGFLVDQYEGVLSILSNLNWESLESIRSNARKTYLELFSVSSFSNKVSAIFEKPFGSE